MSLIKFWFYCCGSTFGPHFKAGWRVGEVTVRVTRGPPQEGRYHPPPGRTGPCLACQERWPLSLVFFGSGDG